jgi:hypothetical protein
MNLSNESLTKYIRKAKSFLLKKGKEIIRPQLASEKPSNNKRKTCHGKLFKESFVKELGAPHVVAGVIYGRDKSCRLFINFPRFSAPDIPVLNVKKIS